MTAAQASQPKTPERLQHLVALLRGFESATFVTRSRGGNLHGRPMSVARVDDDVTVWFITSAASAKTEEVAEDARAMVTVQDGSRFACLNGNAQLVFDPRMIHELWQESFRVWFRGQTDPNIVLLKFTSFDAEYWDNSGVSGIKHAFQAARAYVTGEPLGPGAVDSDDAQSHARLKLWDPGEPGLDEQR